MVMMLHCQLIQSYTNLHYSFNQFSFPRSRNDQWQWTAIGTIALSSIYNTGICELYSHKRTRANILQKKANTWCHEQITATLSNSVVCFHVGYAYTYTYTYNLPLSLFPGCTLHHMRHAQAIIYEWLWTNTIHIIQWVCVVCDCVFIDGQYRKS